MENIFYICITFILVTLINCLNIDVNIGRKQNKNNNHVPLKADKKNPGMMKSEIQKPPKYYPPSLMPKYFEYPPMSDEVKKAYDDAIKNHAKSVIEKLDSKIKPPLGLMPETFHSEARLIDVVNAIERRTSEKIEIPIEWIEEYNRLIKKL